MATLKALQGILSEPPDLPVHVSPLAIESLASPLPPTDPGARAGAATAGLRYALALRAFALQADDDGADLLAPHVIGDRLQPLGYQLQVAREVLRDKAPAAILADEVGMGKTIEAGLILKELSLRGVARSVLIIAPKALLPQWQEELRERFDESFALAEDRGFRGYEHEDRVICSFQQFVMASERIQPRAWDLLIVDEAHLLANTASKRRRAVAALRTRWRLLLTATPVQNKITDLYSLVGLAAPGRFGTQRQFIARYVADPATCRTVQPAKREALRELAAEVMCRTRRADAEIAFARREVETYLVSAGGEEAALSGEITGYLRDLYRRGTAAVPAAGRARAQRATTSGEGDAASAPATGAVAASRGQLIREIIALQQSLSSSPQAIAASLRARAERHPDEAATLRELAVRAARQTSAKERLLVETLKRLKGEPALVFTLRLETARRLRDVLRKSGRSAECYVGELGSDERRALVQRFNGGALQTLIATDAGAEGLNLQQRCHTVFNYDLHWNPMKMEQRIGRVHRLGQRQTVTVANFAVRDSIDEYVLQLLYQKINLFTMTIGALETVLAEVQEGEMDFEERILDLLLGTDNAAARESLAGLGEQVAGTLERVGAAERLTAEVLG
ncbi:MAG TPA: SNF2-related protein [Ktedonobacterales bacterium]|nr:SNF2-related protein [Ktedonobacterales bacterium]